MRLSKFHGLGNDFLVSFDDVELTEDLARRLCDRRRGIGADGLIISRVESPDRITMALRNSDGSRAEMSGNGIRCLAHGAIRRLGRPSAVLDVATAAGSRRVEVTPTDDAATVRARVGMGTVRPGPAWSGALPGGLAEQLTVAVQAETADIGNPHLVLAAADPRAVDLARFGPMLEAQFPAGINVEFIRATPGASDEIDLTVWERGAGITEACGTGASAAACLAHRWGWVGPCVTVHLPGGDVTVIAGDEVELIGPSVHIADIEVPHG